MRADLFMAGYAITAQNELLADSDETPGSRRQGAGIEAIASARSGRLACSVAPSP